MNEAAAALKWYYGDEKKRSPTEYYYVLRKINNKKSPIAGTRVTSELRNIRRHEKNIKKINKYDAESKLQRESLGERSHQVGLDFAAIKEKVTTKKIDILEQVVTEKSEKIESLLRGRNSNYSKDEIAELTRVLRLVKEGNHDMVKRFLMSVPDDFDGLNYCHEPMGNTFLHVAAGKGDLTMCKVLLNFGADPNIRNAFGKIPLHVAWSCFLEAPFFAKKVKRIEAETCIEFLLQYGSDPAAAVLHSGETALHTAAHLGNAKIVARLLSFGGKPLLANKEGMNPLDVAAENKHYEACRVMANWPSVLKFLRVNEVRSKWSTFLRDVESSLAYSEPVAAILLKEETRVVAQKAQVKASKGKVRFHSFENNPKKKTAGRNGLVDDPFNISPVKKKKTRVDMILEQGLQKKRPKRHYRLSRVLHKKKMDKYDDMQRFNVKKTLSFASNEKISPLHRRRLESSRAISSDAFNDTGLYPAQHSPMRKTSKSLGMGSLRLSPVKRTSKVRKEPNPDSQKQGVVYNHPRSLPPKKTSKTPQVLPKASSVEYKIMPERQRIFGITRLDNRNRQLTGKGASMDPWNNGKTELEIEEQLYFADKVQI
jgi:hypothetical protein